MTGVGRISYVSNYLLKVRILVNFWSIVDESFSAKCSIVLRDHFHCFDVIRNKDEWFVKVVGDRREPRSYRWNEVYTDDQNPDLNESWNHGGVIVESSPSTSFRRPAWGGELKIMINLLDRATFIGSLGWKSFNFNVGKGVLTQGRDLGSWSTIFEESCLQVNRCIERK